jgi:HlyD family secretion protein
VAASLQAPVLFTLAQDLSKVQVKISVDEADIGQVQEGQRVRFTVDAYPDDTFQGVVTQVRKQPTTDQNVVAYTVIAEADNPQGKLLPGMTANTDIIIETKANVLKVPAQALRWTPPSETPNRVGAGGPPGLGGPTFVGPGGGGGARRGGGGQGGQRGAMGARVVEQLDLNPAQRKQWDAIQLDTRQQMAQAFASAGGDRAQMRETMRKITTAAFAKLEPSLNAEQKTKLAALRATLAQGRGRQAGMRAGTVYVLKDGKPSAVPVRVGASDGSNTEIVGPLKPGQQVIVGGGPRAKAQIRSPLTGGGPGGAGGQTRVRL